MLHTAGMRQLLRQRRIRFNMSRSRFRDQTRSRCPRSTRLSQDCRRRRRWRSSAIGAHSGIAPSKMLQRSSRTTRSNCYRHRAYGSQFCYQSPSYSLCVPKFRFCNIDGEDRQGQVVRRRRRGAQSRDGEGRPCSEIDESATYYNRRHIGVGSGAGALRQTRSCGRDIRGGSSR